MDQHKRWYSWLVSPSLSIALCIFCAFISIAVEIDRFEINEANTNTVFKILLWYMTTLYDFFVFLLRVSLVLFSLPVFRIVCYSPTNWQIINDSNLIVKHFKFLKKIFYFAARYLTTSFIFPNIKIFELELQLYMY